LRLPLATVVQLEAGYKRNLMIYLVSELEILHCFSQKGLRNSTYETDVYVRLQAHERVRMSTVATGSSVFKPYRE